MIRTRVKNGQYSYYRCNKKERHAAGGKCPTPMIPKDDLEDLVLSEIWDKTRIYGSRSDSRLVFGYKTKQPG